MELKNLFSPKKIGNVQIKNRIVRSATFERRAGKYGHVSDQLIEFYRELARGGTGLIITGFTAVDPSGTASPYQACLFDDSFIPGQKRLVKCVHEYSDVKIAIQIAHTGRLGTHPKYHPIAPSPVFYKRTELTPREMTTDEVKDFIRKFVDTGRRAYECGYDMIQLHAAHGYYLSNFISPRTNMRKDEFGGDIEAEFLFYFSGKHVTWVPGEDSATYIDIIMDFIERKIKRQEPFEKNYSTKTELMENVLKQRSEPFSLLIEQDRENLASFLGAKVWKTDNGWRIKKKFFPEIFIEILWSDKTGLDIKFSGDNLSRNIDSYHIEFVGIFFINHILRFITVNNIEKDLPDICYIMFSRYYTKNIGKWEHRVR